MIEGLGPRTAGLKQEQQEQEEQQQEEEEKEKGGEGLEKEEEANALKLRGDGFTKMIPNLCSNKGAGIAKFPSPPLPYTRQRAGLSLGKRAPHERYGGALSGVIAPR